MLSFNPATLEVTYEDYELPWPAVVVSLAVIIFGIWLAWRRSPAMGKTIAITLIAVAVASTLLGLVLERYATEVD